MGAETADDRSDNAGEAPGATGANVTEQPRQPPSRLSAVLSMMEDVPAEVRKEVVQSKNEAENKIHEQQRADDNRRDERRRGEEGRERERGQSEEGERDPGQAAEAGERAGASGRDNAVAEGTERAAGDNEPEPARSADVAAEDDHPPDDWPDSARQRVSKLKAKRDEFKTQAQTEAEKRAAAERERDELKQRLENTRPVQLAPTPNDPLARVEDESQLQRAAANYEWMFEWAELNRDGVEAGTETLDFEGKPFKTERDLTPRDMAVLKIEAEAALRKHIPNKAAYLQERKVSDAAAREQYPELFDTSSEDYQLARNIMQQMPELMRFGSAYLNMGRFLRGYKAEQQEIAARKNGKIPVSQHARGAQNSGTNNGNGDRSKIEPFTRPQPPIAPSTPKVRGGSAAPVTEDGEIKAAKARIVDDESDEALEGLVRATRAIGRQRGGRQPTLA